MIDSVIVVCVCVSMGSVCLCVCLGLRVLNKILFTLGKPQTSRTFSHNICLSIAYPSPMNIYTYILLQLALTSLALNGLKQRLELL